MLIAGWVVPFVGWHLPAGWLSAGWCPLAGWGLGWTYWRMGCGEKQQMACGDDGWVKLSH